MEPILQPSAIDVSGWRVDEQYFNYPEGARPKRAVFPPQVLEFAFIHRELRYLYKRSDKRYADQFWGEVVAYQVGGLLGVVVPPAFAAYDSNVGDCAALVEWFYRDGQAVFVPGGNYMQQMMPAYDRKRGMDHNFRSVQTIARSFVNAGRADDTWQQYWAEAFVFDALIGNTDRHQDNWGYLSVEPAADNLIRLAPLFDNGTSLGHERFPGAVKKWGDEDFKRYLAKGTHHMKWEKDDERKCGHFEMIARIVEAFPVLKAHLLEKVERFSLDELSDRLSHLRRLDLPIRLSDERCELYLKLINLRRTQILAVLA